MTAYSRVGKRVSSTLSSIKLKLSAENLRGTVAAAFNDDVIVAHWFSAVPGNWGDALNPVLIAAISGKRVLQASDIFLPPSTDVFQVIGSILGHRLPNLRIWGAGFISHTATLPRKPKAIHAVRGPHTRDKLLKQGLDCPPIYGDPACLLPRFYKPPSEKRFALGVIPHYVDQRDPWLTSVKGDPEVLVIDVLGGVWEFADAVCSCERIVSSSLHGLIAADAYEVPSLWVEFADRISGDGFKFADYFASVGVSDMSPVQISPSTRLTELLEARMSVRPPINYEDLIGSCPFLPATAQDSLPCWSD